MSFTFRKRDVQVVMSKRGFNFYPFFFSVIFFYLLKLKVTDTADTGIITDYIIVFICVISWRV